MKRITEGTYSVDVECPRCHQGLNVLASLPKAIAAINPPEIPYFAGGLQVTMDEFGEDATDRPATAIINYLNGEGEQV